MGLHFRERRFLLMTALVQTFLELNNGESNVAVTLWICIRVGGVLETKFSRITAYGFSRIL
jgi:hypothetical protein